MKKEKLFCRSKVMSAVLSAVIVFSMISTLGIMDVFAASDERCTVVIPDFTFVVPETIYLYPDLASGDNATSAPFQYYINETAEYGISGTYDKTGKIYFEYPNAEDATLSWEFFREDAVHSDTEYWRFWPMEDGSVTVSDTVLGTKKTVNITGGVSPELESDQEGCYIRWCISYTDTIDGLAKKAYNYTYVYKPYVGVVAAGVDIGAGWKSATYAGSLTWISGMNSYTSNHTKLNSYDDWDSYKCGYTGKNFAAFISKESTIYVNGQKANTRRSDYATSQEVQSGSNGMYYAVDETGIDGYYLQSTNNQSPHCYYADYSDNNHCNIVVGNYRKNWPSVNGNVMNKSVAELYVDTSRYSNLNQIPNLAVGFTVTDDRETAEESGTWYIGDATGKTFGDSYFKFHTSESYYNDYTRHFARGCHPSWGKYARLTDSKEGIRYLGDWVAPLYGDLNTQGASATYYVHGYFADSDNDNYSAERHNGIVPIYDASGNTVCQLQATYYNKAALRAAVKNAENAMAKLGVIGDEGYIHPDSAFFDTANENWAAFCMAYRNAIVGLTTIGEKTDMDALASALNTALEPLLLVGPGHHFDEIQATVIREANCTKPAVYEVPCANCSVTEEREMGEPLGHDYEPGIEHKYLDGQIITNTFLCCTRCGDIKDIQSKSEISEDEVFDPDIGTIIKKDAKVQFKAKHAGEWMDVVYCYEDSKETHSYSEVWTAPEWVKCTDIHYDADNNNYVVCFEKYCLFSEPTCTEPATCIFCLETKGEALGHSFTDKVSDQQVAAADCLTPATYYVQCDRCDAVDTEKTVSEGKALGHIFDDNCDDSCNRCGELRTAPHNWQAATCTASKTCRDCHLTEGQALGHSFTGKASAQKASDANCTETATYYVQCNNCGEISSTVTVTVGEPLGHSFNEPSSQKASDATCTELATYYVQCCRCKAVNKDEVIGVDDALGHKWSAWTSVSDTQHQRVCENDGTHKEIADHAWDDGEETSAATHTAEGITTYTCTDCGKTKTETIAKLAAHTFDQVVADEQYLKSEATCTDAAVYYKSCKCGEMGTETFTYGKALGHKWQDATCTAPKTCSVCNATEGAALGHKWKDATCTEPKTCSVCNATEGAALGHKWKDTTCTEPKTCSVCNATEGEALGHMWGAWTSIGSMQHQRVCERDPAHMETAKHNFKGGICADCGYIRSGGADPVVPVTPVKPALPFEDVKASDWSYDDIAYVYEKGLMNGVSETLFAPQTNTSRAMIVTILYRLEGEPAFMNDNIFTDVERGSWYEKAVIWANGKGIVNGYGDGKFGPDDPITREQMAVILYRYCRYKEYDVSIDENTNFLSYTDFQNTNEYAMTPMMWAIENGILQGSNYVLNPQDNATREQVAAILHRFCEMIEK